MSTPTTSPSIPSDYSQPLAASDPNNHASWIIICNAFGLLVILICLLIRVWIRTKVSPPFGQDDHTLTVATVFAIIQTSVVFQLVNTGYGKSLELIPASHIPTLQKYAYAAQILYIITIYLSKASIVMLFRRISHTDRSHALAAWITLATCATFGVVSVLLVALKCELNHPWLQYYQSCPTLVGQWSAVTAFDIITEVMLFAMSIQLVWGLQTPWSRKSRVVFAFALRLPLIAIAAIRLDYISEQIHSSNPTLLGSITWVITQLEVFYAIMATTIPCLRPFLAGFVTNFGAMGGDTVMGGSQIGTSKDKKDTKAGSKGSFAMASLGSSSEGEKAGHHLHPNGRNQSVSRTRRFREKTSLKSRDRSRARAAAAGAGGGGEMFRPDITQHETSVSHSAGNHHLHHHHDQQHAGDSSSLVSNDSQRMLYIRKEVQWQVESDGSTLRGPSRADDYDDDRGVNHV